MRGKPSKLFSAPFDVRLPLPSSSHTDDKIDTVVQPDICIVCDPAKLDERGCIGAPDWIIEILSKATSQKDLTDKFDLYQHAGVREYWVVHPTECTVIPYRLTNRASTSPCAPIPSSRARKSPLESSPTSPLNSARCFIRKNGEGKG